MLRFESRGKRRVSEEVVRRSKISHRDFETYMQSAIQLEAQAMRTRLKREFLPDDVRDHGKTVLFEDLAFFGVSPQALGREDDVVITSDVKQALSNLQWLEHHSDPSGRYVGLFGFPTSKEQMEAVFGTANTFGTLEQWRQHRSDAEAIATNYGIELVDQFTEDSLDSKEQLLKRFEEADGIIFVVAHANHCTVHLPGGTDISITPQDIAQLNLVKKPFVVLRVCQAEDHGFAGAFVHAGARGVWINRGIIGADTANNHVAAFMKEVRAGATIGAAISSLRTANPDMRVGTHLVVELRESRGPAEGKHQRAVGSIER